MHQRLGHQSFQSLLAASHENLWEDVSLRFAPESFCIGCKVATRRSAARGNRPVTEPSRPGKILFMDLIHNPASISITTSTYWPYYLIVVCAYSRYGVLIPTWKSDTAAVIASIYDFVSFHKPYPDYSLDAISEVHADAGPCFRSQEFFDWGSDSQIKIVLAGSHHQEMNGLPERRWQAIRLRAFCMLNHARFSHAFLHFALMYSWQITNILPLRGLVIIRVDDPEERAACPFELYFLGKRARASRFCVFGCPIVAKCYIKKHETTGVVMDDRTII
jgi:hypothetical protein